MKNKILIVAFLCISLNLLAQEGEFYTSDNSYHEIYRKAKVKALKVFTEEYSDGKLTDKYLELVQHFDKNGYLLREREYFDSDTTDGWKINYTYNSKHQIIKEEWTWLEDNEKELAEFFYDSNDKLIKSCDYIKSQTMPYYRLDGCEQYKYKNGKLHKVLSADNTVLSYYKNDNGIISEFDTNNKLVAKYKNGRMFYLYGDTINYNYERNRIGQLTKTTAKTTKNKIESQTYFEYTDGLLKKVTYKDSFGNITGIENYFYEYFE